MTVKVSPKIAKGFHHKRNETDSTLTEIKRKSQDFESIKEMLKTHGVRGMTKEDIYFRNQLKLMSNSNIPEAEKIKLSRKARF